jgi:hypothetical protein
MNRELEHGKEQHHNGRLFQTSREQRACGGVSLLLLSSPTDSCMNFCFHFSGRLLRVLVGPIDGSAKEKDVLGKIASKWTNRSVDGFLRADVVDILQRWGRLNDDDIGNLNTQITTFANLVAGTSQALNDRFSELTENMRAADAGSSLSAGGSGSDASIDDQSMGANPSDASGQSGESAGPNPASDSVETMGPADNVEYRLDY